MTGKERTSAATSPLRVARKAVVAVIGLSVLAFGVALIVLPGPAFVVIPAGLAILATEFLWARRLLRDVKARAERALGALRGDTAGRDGASCENSCGAAAKKLERSIYDDD